MRQPIIPHIKQYLHFFYGHNAALTFFMMTAATLCSFIFLYYVPSGSADIPLFYVFALIITACCTNGYRFSIAASLVSVLCINYFFTYPHFKLNFTLSGYPVTFFVMLAITFVTGTLASHMKQQAQALTEHEKNLAAAEKEKMRANLLRAVSHDLRTPLTGIIGSVTALQEIENIQADAEILETVRGIQNDASWLLNMVENLLSVTRIQSTDASVKKSTEVVEEVVSEAVARLKKRLPDSLITVTLPDDFIMIPMDAILIEQVLINLLENACIHSQSTQPIRLRVSADAYSVTFEVMDFGIGIAPQRLETIFDGMPSDTSAAADSTKGFGIGLSICRTIILAHNGTISARNHAQGAVFTFTLPASVSKVPSQDLQ